MKKKLPAGRDETRAYASSTSATVTLPKGLKAASAESMLKSKAAKKGGKLVAWKYDPRTGRAAFRWV